MGYKLLVIGTSAGGIEALKELLPRLMRPFPIPIVVIQHLQASRTSYLHEILSKMSDLTGLEVGDKVQIQKGYIYTAVANYHVLMEKDWSFSLSVGPRVSYARPSIDVFFETAADAVKEDLIGVLLTGANQDGANGLKAIKDMGGYCIVQDPEEAMVHTMPDMGIKVADPHQVLKLKEIAEAINELMSESEGL